MPIIPKDDGPWPCRSVEGRIAAVGGSLLGDGLAEDAAEEDLSRHAVGVAQLLDAGHQGPEQDLGLVALAHVVLGHDGELLRRPLRHRVVKTGVVHGLHQHEKLATWVTLGLAHDVPCPFVSLLAFQANPEGC